MSFLSRLFVNGQPLKECPRCLGKGHVDWDDINRLKQELKWIPGTCAYCNGKGKINPKVEANVPVDTTYLVTNLPEAERKKILNGNPDALERAYQYNDGIERFFHQICQLHFERNLSPSQIAEYFMAGKEGSDSYETEKREFVAYVEKVIYKRSGG